MAVVISMAVRRPGQGQSKAESAADKRLGGMAADQPSHARQRKEEVLRGG
jgi:hypothetical protein